MAQVVECLHKAPSLKKKKSSAKKTPNLWDRRINDLYSGTVLGMCAAPVSETDNTCASCRSEGYRNMEIRHSNLFWDSH
jgi:hypothetical protein